MISKLDLTIQSASNARQLKKLREQCNEIQTISNSIAKLYQIKGEIETSHRFYLIQGMLIDATKKFNNFEANQ